MSPDTSGTAGPHPDLRSLYCNALGLIGDSSMPSSHPDVPGLFARLQPDDLTIRCRRTWHGIRSINPALNGGDFAASIIQFSADGHHFSFFIEAMRPAGENEWQWGGTSGGERPVDEMENVGGFSVIGGSYVCVGGLTTNRPNVAAIQVEHADSSQITVAVGDDGAVIALAPVVSAPSSEDEVIVRNLDASGGVLSEDRTWIGDGGPPPADMFAAMRS